MKITFNDDIQYGMKYKVYKLDSSNFLLFPICLVKGFEDIKGFKTSNEMIPFVKNKNDLNNRFVVDTIYDKAALEHLYEFENDDEFLSDYFYEEHRNIIILINAEGRNLSKCCVEFKKITPKSIDENYFIYKNYPSVILNENAVDKLLSCKSLDEMEKELHRYKGLINSFQSMNQNNKVTKISVSDGKVESFETLKGVSSVKKNDVVISEINEEIERKKEEKFDECDISYNGLRNYIKQRVLGHEREIDTFAQKIYMNYTAMDDESIESILLVGPTGTGKTETVHAACEYLDIPSYEVNASNIVPQGIKGMSIEDVISGLYENAGRNVKKAEKGIIFLDEFDKLNDSSLDLKEPVKNILLTFTSGGVFPIDNDYYKFTFNSSRTTKIYAGVFDRIGAKIKSLGFNSVLEFNSILESDEEIRKKIIDQKYFTLEELSRISTILAYNELDRETKRKILLSSKLSEFIKKRDRYKRQFGIDLIASDDYIDAILDSLDKDALGMRSVNNYVKRTINEVEKSILEGETHGCKQLILTRDTVSNPRSFEVR